MDENLFQIFFQKICELYNLSKISLISMWLQTQISKKHLNIIILY